MRDFVFDEGGWACWPLAYYLSVRMEGARIRPAAVGERETATLHLEHSGELTDLPVRYWRGWRVQGGRSRVIDQEVESRIEGRVMESWGWERVRSPMRLVLGQKVRSED